MAGYAILIVDERRALLDNVAIDPAHQRLEIGQALVDRSSAKSLQWATRPWTSKTMSS